MNGQLLFVIVLIGLIWISVVVLIIGALKIGKKSDVDITKKVIDNNNDDVAKNLLMFEEDNEQINALRSKQEQHKKRDELND